MSPASTTLGQRVASRRAALGLTQRVLSQRCGCEQATISRIENGHAENISRHTMESLAVALGWTLDELSRGKRAKSARGA